MQGGLFAIDGKLVTRLLSFHVPIHVYHTGGFLHDVSDLTRELPLAIVVGPVDLSHQGCKHGWARGNLSHLHPRVVPLGNQLQLGAHPFGDFVALIPATVLGDKVDLKVGFDLDRGAGNSAVPGRWKLNGPEVPI